MVEYNRLAQKRMQSEDKSVELILLFYIFLRILVFTNQMSEVLALAYWLSEVFKALFTKSFSMARAFYPWSIGTK